MTPPIMVLTGPAGSGKTSACARRYAEAPDRARLTVPTAAHAERVRAIVRTLGCNEIDGIVSFGELIRELAGARNSHIITPAYRRLALAAIFRDEIPPDGYFGRMHGAGGFPSALGEIVQELRLSSATPDALVRAASDAAPAIPDPLFQSKASEIARLCRTYERFLAAHDLVDEESLPAIAAKRVAEMPERPFDALLVDGFHRLSRAWRDLLTSLALRGVEVTVTLTLEEERELLFAATLRTLDALKHEFDVSASCLPRRLSDRPAPLKRLEQRIFSGRPDSDESETPDSSGAPALLLFDAPNPYVEVEMVARALAQEHREHGTPWDRCAILLRSPSDYAATLSSVFERYGIPLSLPGARPLGEIPAIKPLIALLRILTDSWQRTDVIAFVRSSFLGGRKIEADRLLRRARKAGVRLGREGWAALCEQERERRGPLADLLARTLAWDSRLYADRRLPGEHASMVSALADDFGLLRDGRSGGRDAAAVQRALAVAGDLGRVMEAMSSEALPFERYARELLGAWRFASLAEPPPSDAVVVLEPYDVRQQDSDVAVVMGLVERSFPRRVIDDPFFRDDERAALSATGHVAIESRRERADDERLLFYLSVTAPSRRLILSFPRSSGEADTLPSFYLDEVRAAVGIVRTDVRTLADIAPHADECVDDRDRLLVALVEEPRPPALSPAAPGEVAGARAPGLPGDSLVRRAAELRESAGLPPLPKILDPELRQAYGAPRRYRVTEIEEYNRCPFLHFVRHGLRVMPEPGSGGPADRGTLYHAVLSRCFRRRKSSPDAALKADLLNELADILRCNSTDAAPHRRRALERYLAEAVDGFARREEILGPRFGFTPAHFELAFGLNSGATDLDGEPRERDYDEASVGTPLAIQQAGAQPIHLCGVIDRVDVASDTALALAIDYKTGETPTYGQMQAGHSLQMPLYLMALEQLWGKIGVAGCHDSPRESGRRRFFRLEHADLKRFGMVSELEQGKEMVKPVTPDEHAETTRAVVESVVRAAAGISAAGILPTPGDHCRTCEYADCCRTTPDFQHDGEAYDIMTES